MSVRPDSATARAIEGRRVLITGGAGSVGSELARQILSAGPRTLVLVDINENSLYLLCRHLEQVRASAQLMPELADIRDDRRLRALMRRHQPQDIFHTAAHKHLPLLEDAPCEAVKNNVLGTRLVAEAAIATGVERFVFLSTDKAVRPASVLGVSKRLGELLVRSLAQRSATRFCTVRFGNVLESAGSVVPLFRQQISAGGPVTVTHPEARRYFLNLKETASRILQAAYGDPAALWVLEMGEPVRIVDLARREIAAAGRIPEHEIPIVFTGLRPGERLEEELLAPGEQRMRRVDGKLWAVASPAQIPGLEDRIDQLIRAAEKEDDEQVRHHLREMVRDWGGTSGTPADEVSSGPTP